MMFFRYKQVVLTVVLLSTLFSTSCSKANKTEQFDFRLSHSDGRSLAQLRTGETHQLRMWLTGTQGTIIEDAVADIHVASAECFYIEEPRFQLQQSGEDDNTPKEFYQDFNLEISADCVETGSSQLQIDVLAFTSKGRELRKRLQQHIHLAEARVLSSLQLKTVRVNGQLRSIVFPGETLQLRYDIFNPSHQDSEPLRLIVQSSPLAFLDKIHAQSFQIEALPSKQTAHLQEGLVLQVPVDMPASSVLQLHAGILPSTDSEDIKELSSLASEIFVAEAPKLIIESLTAIHTTDANEGLEWKLELSMLNDSELDLCSGTIILDENADVSSIESRNRSVFKRLPARSQTRLEPSIHIKLPYLLSEDGLKIAFRWQSRCGYSGYSFLPLSLKQLEEK